MHRLLTIFAMVLIGCGTAVAQAGSVNTRRAPATPMTSSTSMPMTSSTANPITSPTAVPGTIPTIGATGNPLGAVLLNLGTLGPIPGTSLGAITVCPTTGITISTTTTATPIVTTTPTTTVVASSSTTATPGLTSSSPPAAPLPVTSSSPSVAPLPVMSTFGMETMSGFCNPTPIAPVAPSSVS